ncbi:MAG: NAD(P)/FAD-dependent oxidoreductase [Deltaproteobacteria bacterium]|nr:MAG: NAD(P)/FAD-dependent oxidoreductase [Deltaproteobacteria bacterium]
MAKYLRKENPEFDVVLVERRSLFMSCPMSNLWLAGLTDLEFLTHSYLDAARNNGYLFFNASMVDLDREARRVFTDQGYIDYEFLVLAPGIDYNYKAIGVEDLEAEYALRQNYPGGFIPGSEHLSIRAKLEDFEEGLFVLTVPPGNYRCLPGPYERACLVAHYFKKEQIPGKVVLLDANPDVTIKRNAFHEAFDTLYKDVLEYRPSFEITSVDPFKKVISSDFEDVEFADAAIYPRVRAHKLIEQLGLADPKSPQYEAKIDVFFNNLVDDPHVYVVGDARPMPFSKSGNTANSEAKNIARVIAARAAGREPGEWVPPHTVCYSVVNGDPVEAVMVDARYKFDEASKQFAFDKVKLLEERSTAMGQAAFEWAEGLYRDMFA